MNKLEEFNLIVVLAVNLSLLIETWVRILGSGAV